MSLIQRLFAALLPERWMAAMEADSRRWMINCSCGFAISVWEIGGIRYKAYGESRLYRRCPQCGKRSWQKLSYNRPPSP